MLNKIQKIAFALPVLFAAPLALADSFTSYGDVSVVSQGPPSDNPSFQLTSDAEGDGYAGLEFDPSGTLSFDDLTTLSADYQMTTGSFENGAPRFSIFDSEGNALYVYWGTSGSYNNPNDDSTWANTGNFIDPSSPDIHFEFNGFDGISYSYPDLTYAEAKAEIDDFGNGDPIEAVTLDLDGGYEGYSPAQVMLVNNFDVDGNIDQAETPEPASLGLLSAAGLFAARRRRRA
jgi:PEP-CTERM motif-containing protein